MNARCTEIEDVREQWTGNTDRTQSNNVPFIFPIIDIFLYLFHFFPIFLGLSRRRIIVLHGREEYEKGLLQTEQHKETWNYEGDRVGMGKRPDLQNDVQNTIFGPFGRMILLRHEISRGLVGKVSFVTPLG